MGRNSTSHFPSIFDPLPLKRIPPKIKKFKKILKLNQNCEKVNFKKKRILSPLTKKALI